MIPDKIYVHLTPHLGLLEATAIPVNAPDEQEYIRKVALIEMLKGYSHPLTRVVVQELIDKINEL